MALQSIIVPHSPGYDFGIGVDRLSGSARNKCVEGAITTVERAPGSYSRFEVKRIQSTEELNQKLGVDASASAGCAMFGPSLSARFKWATDKKVQTSSLFMTISATILTADLSIDEPTLTHAAGEMVDNQPHFEARYGNCFARTLRRGGLFVAVLQIETASSESATEIESTLKGSYALFAAEASTTWHDVLKNNSVSIYCDIYTEGGPPARQADPSDAKELLTHANDWITAMATAPDANSVPYQWELAPTEIAEGPTLPNSEDIEHAQDVLLFCARRRAVAIDALNLLEWIISQPANFDWTGSATLEELKSSSDAYQTELDFIADCASAAMEHPNGAKYPAGFQPLDGRTYVQGTMPAKLPKPLAAATPAPAPTPSSIVTIPWVVGDEMNIPSYGGYRVLQDRTEEHLDPPPTPLAPLGYIPSADEAGLIVSFRAPLGGHISKIEPAAGSTVARGSTVLIYGQGPKFYAAG